VTGRPPATGTDDGGYALLVVVIVSVIVVTIITALIVPVVVDNRTTALARQRNDGRLLAETVLNELHADVVANPDGLASIALAGRVAPGKRVTDAGLVDGWARWDATNRRYAACDDLRTPCFSYTVAQDTSTATGGPRAVVVEVTTRVGCRTTPQSCTYTRLQQRWRRRAFLDYLLFTDRETTAPSLYSGTAPDCDKPPVPPGETPDPGERPATCKDVAYIGRAATTTTASQLWYGEEWLNTTGTDWTLTAAGDKTTSETAYAERKRAAAPADTVAHVAKGAALMVSQFRAEVAGSYTLAATSDEALRLRWRINGGTWGSAQDTVTPFSVSPAAFTLAVGDKVTVEILVLNNAPATFSPAVTLDPPGATAALALIGANTGTGAGKLGVTPTTVSLVEAVDELTGPIHTNDPWFWVCGRPKFTDLVETTGTNQFERATTSCTNDADAPSDKLRTGPELELPSSTTPFADIAGANWTFTGPATVVFANTTVTVTDGGGIETTPFTPTGGVIHVVGDVTVRGNARSVTVSATGTATIDGDLTGDDIGIVASSDVIIGYSRTGRTVQASLLSLNGTVYVDGWDTKVPPLYGAPALTLTGAMAAKYRPVFATYDPADGTLLTGVSKRFAYPARAPNPPWFLGPVRALWDRVEIAEVPALVDGLALAPDPTATTATAACATAGTMPYLRACLQP
jgi:hypothetical protein